MQFQNEIAHVKSAVEKSTGVVLEASVIEECITNATVKTVRNGYDQDYFMIVFKEELSNHIACATMNSIGLAYISEEGMN